MGTSSLPNSRSTYLESHPLLRISFVPALLRDQQVAGEPLSPTWTGRGALQGSWERPRLEFFTEGPALPLPSGLEVGRS